MSACENLQTDLCVCFQGPEHSSARPERFLQMCNDDPDVLPVSRTDPELNCLRASRKEFHLDVLRGQISAAAGAPSGLGIRRVAQCDPMPSDLPEIGYFICFLLLLKAEDPWSDLLGDIAIALVQIGF